MKNYQERADRFAASKLVGTIRWKRRDTKTYMYLGDIIVVHDGKSQGLQKAILLVTFDEQDTMRFSLTPHTRAMEIFMSANFKTSH
jgi:hypothetical protein